MILEQLEAIREQFPDCETLAFADISSGTVLCVSAATKLPQERLDAYCSVSAQLLHGPASQAFSQALADPEPAPVQEASILSEGRTIFVLRSPEDADEGMFCVCAAGIDVDLFLPAARAGLAQIAAQQ